MTPKPPPPTSTSSDPHRPGFHVTAPAGWINDPLGVTWHAGPEGGRYELFFQYNPQAAVWVAECRWGQVTSPDLVRWGDLRTALEPGPEETGCWSGSVVVRDGVPVIVYTSVLADEPGMGRVALAEGDAAWRRWTPDPAGPVIPAPEPERGFAHVRDPFVWRDGEQWRMALGAGDTAGRPSVLQYSSPDLRQWRLDGELAGPEDGRPDPGGAVWECPQLFPLEGSWVLMVSVWDEGPGGVACAVGDYDGQRFVARAWHRLAGEPLYATTAFADAAGRRCALSWIQEAGSEGGAWSGALSVPWLLGRDGDRVTVVPHPDVDTLRTRVLAEHGPVALSRGPCEVTVPAAHLDVTLAAEPGGRPVVLAVDGSGGPVLTLTADPGAGQARLTAPGHPDVVAPMRAEPDGAIGLRLLLDGGVAEVFTGSGGVAAARVLPPGDGLAIRVTGGDGARLRHLVVHEMARVIG